MTKGAGLGARATRKRQLDGNRSIAEESDRTRSLQQQLRDNARADVNGAPARWQAENRQIQQTYAAQASSKRAEIDGQIQQKVSTTNREVDQKLTDAEKAAETERTKSEAEAQAKKREAENRPQKLVGESRRRSVQRDRERTIRHQQRLRTTPKKPSAASSMPPGLPSVR